MELLYICDLEGEWVDFIYTFSQLLPGLVAGALVRYVLWGVGIAKCVGCRCPGESYSIETSATTLLIHFLLHKTMKTIIIIDLITVWKQKIQAHWFDSLISLLSQTSALVYLCRL